MIPVINPALLDPRVYLWRGQRFRVFWETHCGASVTAEHLDGPHKGKWTQVPVTLEVEL